MRPEIKNKLIKFLERGDVDSALSFLKEIKERNVCPSTSSG